MLALGVHSCAVTRALETHLLDESPPWLILNGADQECPEGYFPLATSLDCEDSCTVYVRPMRRPV